MNFEICLIQNTYILILITHSLTYSIRHKNIYNRNYI